MTEITKERRDAIRAAAMKATPGPWEATVAYGNSEDDVWVQITAPDCDAVVAKFPEDTNDIPHIANCDPQTILALLDALDAAEAKTGEPVAFKHYTRRHMPGHHDSGGEVVVPFTDDDEMEAIRAALAAPPAVEPLSPDYFGSLVERARNAAERASRKFPQPNYVTLKIAEEAGEVVRGCVHYAENRMEWSEVEGEIVQLLAMLIRLVTEGDQINGVTPPAMLAAAPALTTSPEPSHE